MTHYGIFQGVSAIVSDCCNALVMHNTVSGEERCSACMTSLSQSQHLKSEKDTVDSLNESRIIRCSTKEYPVAAVIISYQTYGSGDRPGADYCLKLANLDRAIGEGYADEMLVMLSVIGKQILDRRAQLTQHIAMKS